MAAKKSSRRSKAGKKAGKKASKKTGRKTGRKSAKRSSRRKSAARELIAPRGDNRYVRRDRRGRISESDDQGRSLATDRRRKAKRRVKAGQGDKGDRG